jgi:serine O-acetyltransferase
VASDLYRYDGVISRRSFWRNFLITPGFRYSVILRLTQYARGQRWARFGLRQFMMFMHYRYSVRYGISIHPQTRVGAGLYIGHFGGIVIGGGVTIGDNCNLSQGVTIGVSGEGAKRGAPVIGDDVYVGPGARVFGPIRIGDNVKIGPNAVVHEDIPANAIVVLEPGFRIVSYRGNRRLEAIPGDRSRSASTG